MLQLGREIDPKRLQEFSPKMQKATSIQEYPKIFNEYHEITKNLKLAKDDLKFLEQAEGANARERMQRKRKIEGLEKDYLADKGTILNKPEVEKAIEDCIVKMINKWEIEEKNKKEELDALGDEIRDEYRSFYEQLSQLSNINRNAETQLAELEDLRIQATSITESDNNNNAKSYEEKQRAEAFLKLVSNKTIEKLEDQIKEDRTIIEEIVSCLKGTGTTNEDLAADDR